MTEETTRSSENDSESERAGRGAECGATNKEAIHALEEVTLFLDYKGYADEAYETSKLVNSLSSAMIQASPPPPPPPVASWSGLGPSTF